MVAILGPAARHARTGIGVDVGSPWVVGVFCLYFAGLILIALSGARRMRNMGDYVLGGRRLSSFTAALSAGSSTTSAWTMLALPGLAFAHGLGEMWIPVAASLGIWLSWTVLARRLRRYTIEAGDILTLPEFYEVRFGDTTGLLRTVASLITVLFVLFYVTSGLVGGAKLLETIFDVDAATGVLLTLFVVVTYTLIGGFLAVSRTDVFQALLMLGSLALIALVLTAHAEGGPAGVDSGRGLLNPFTHEGRPLDLFFALSTAGWALGAFGSQRILQRFMALEDEELVERSRNISLVWLVSVYGLALAVGLLAGPVLTERDLLPEVADPERVFLVVSEVFFHPAVTGVLLVAVIAAVMSTADSQLLLASAVATDDVPLMRRLSRRLAQRARVWLGRGLLVVIGGAAAFVAIFFPESIFELVSYAWGGMGAAFGPVTILALYWRRLNAWGAGSSIVAGTLVATLWWSLSGGPGGVWEIQPATPGFLVATGVAVLVSLLTPGPPREVVALYDRVNAPPARR
ncbi:MAG: sodium/proline symporter [Chloroflexi bacterium]|nr:sodium/proline symporter [Chloroflexota bacterium]